jgi:hypothetical protein
MILITVALPLRALADVDVPAAPPIATTPESGVDPDIAARFSSADDLLARGDLGGALAAVLVTFQSPDPFSQAQGELLKPRAAALLAQIGERARRADQIVLAARAYDARWTLAGARGRERDPDLARVLLTWSERETSRGRALYLTRRARQADPMFEAAAARDQQLSSNRRVWTGRLAIVAGALVFGAGLYCDIHGQNDVATALYVAGPALSTTGALVLLGGVPHGDPVSPAELPVLPAR